MDINTLFIEREQMGKNILQYIKKKGFTKSTFSTLVDISRPTLNRLINGEINSITTFETHIRKIIANQKITIDDLIESEYTKTNNLQYSFSNHAPEDYEMNNSSKEMVGIIEDVISLYEIYS